MKAFDRHEIEEAHARAGRLYHELLREPAMSAGLYRLPAGASDPQRPHEQDELYVVLDGRAAIVVEPGDVRRELRAGSVVYVPARASHRFVDIAEDLAVLVVFAPPES
jgi:mannose-6-phosphate isomerase-like protein (cupin superfamily)